MRRASDSVAIGADIEGLIGGIGNDLIYGDSANNYLYGMGGNDMIDGGVGNDTFIMRLGYGRDTVSDFAAIDGDFIDFHGVFADYNAAMATAVQVGANVEFRLDASDVLVVEKVNIGQLVASEFKF